MRQLFTITLASIILALSSNMTAWAQEINVVDTLMVPDGYELVDSVIYTPNVAVDTALVGKNIFDIISNGAMMTKSVKIRQSEDILKSFHNYVQANLTRQMTGYRVRIFFDNSRIARVESEKILNSFRLLHHDIRAYRSYVNPYFKVTVGDFRTRSEAMDLLTKIREEFPSAFIVKEPINYPPLDKTKPMIEDTVRVLRPKMSLE